MALNQLYVAVWLVVTATLMAYALRAPVAAWWGRAAAAFGVVFFLVGSVASAPPWEIAHDFRSFWNTGAVILSGQDPIDQLAGQSLPPLNPPTVYPLFAAFAVFPGRASLVIWVAVSALICLALVPLSGRILADRGVPGAGATPRWGLGLVTAAFVMSNAPRSMLQSGQLAAAGALGLLAALAEQGRGRPARAGAWLVLGTVKPNSTLPFVLLFLRRRDLTTWVVFAALSAAVCLAIGRPAETPRRVSLYLRTIQKHGRPGGVNDVTFSGPQTAGMVGLDYALYRLGFRDARSASLAQGAALLALGAVLARRVLRRSGLPTGSDCVQVALYSTVFLYHRTQDFVILALPLTYAVLRARAASGRARWVFAGATAAILLALSHQRKGVELLESALKTRHDPAALLAQALVLPYATWLVLAAMLALALGERLGPPEGDGSG